MSKIVVYESPFKNYVSVYDEDYRGENIAEASLVTGDVHDWYFNRILVSNRLRGKGIASKILDELLRFMKNNKYNLLCEINPYGDLSYNQLKDWYIRHGFEEMSKNLLIYKGDR